jgi:long-chain acyl-CoA synthetase
MTFSRTQVRYLDRTRHIQMANILSTASKVPTNKCLGHRPWNSDTRKFEKYVWLTYGEVQQKRMNFGSGLVQLHEKYGVTGRQYGVGLWCQNRPEWQITGTKSDITATVGLY